MPQTEASNGPQLAIRLEREHHSFTIPDTVVGVVARQTEIVTSKATLNISLVGRSKSRMVVRHGSWGRTYRGRFPLLDDSEYTQKLFEAPLHIPANGQEKTWPFAITLPTKFDVRKAGQGATQDQSFLPLQGDDSAMRKLPPSFAAQEWGYGYGMGCFVEYYLRAELTTTGRGTSHQVEAILPLTITTLHDGLRREREQWRSTKHSLTANTSLLLSNGSTTEASSSAPEPHPRRSNIVVEVRTPSRLHLDRTGSVPLFLVAKIDPKHDSEETTLSSQQVLIKQILVDLVAFTSVKCQGKRGAREASTKTKFKICTKEMYEASSALVIPWAEEKSTSNGTDSVASPTAQEARRAVNAGDKVGMTLPSEGLFESFTTHNIQHTYSLEWAITVQLSGQHLDFKGSEAVEMAAPSRDSAPIDYEALQNDDLLERTRSASAEGLPPEYGREDFDQPLPPRETERSRAGGAYGLSSLWQNVG